MSHLYIYSPSSANRDVKSLKRGIAYLKAQGHQVMCDEAMLAVDTRFAGSDEERIAAIKRAAQSGADVAIISRGGYGLTRILPKLPYKAIAKSIDKGMRWVGFSDFTALQLAQWAQTGHSTWAGPAVGEDFGAQIEPDGSPDAIMAACFEDLLCGSSEGAGWRLPKRAAAGIKPFEVHDAPLWGGNLCVLTALLGTPYFPRTEQIKGGILFLEDVAEHPYRIERMLTQLLHAGVLATQQAIVLGSFNKYNKSPADKGYKLETVVDWLRSQLKAAKCKTPVLTDLPFGHVPTKVMLPVGKKVNMAFDGQEAVLVWGHAHE